MKNIPRPAPFMLLSTNHGSMIVNRNDYHASPGGTFGVGYELMSQSGYEQEEIDFVLALLASCLRDKGPGVLAIDCGANIGVHTIEWARFMYGWGHVIAFEAQEKIYYALAGNIVLNNCFNVNAMNSAVGAECGHIDIPEPDYLVPGSFGSFELKPSGCGEDIGQPIDYGNRPLRVEMVTLDSLALERVDLVKIDVEGMEEQVLAGAESLLRRHRPILFVEMLKSDKEAIRARLASLGYIVFPAGINALAIHESDPLRVRLKNEDGRLQLV
ncbi:FkbM family methyltransferase [Paludibacterium paludis]|uniref:Methyltransferase FkbM domain-containing protein n=1 Tax=Paludibacterium paludis TaxID=1225769 RepID=A0A918NZ33_9NEIS|nr:FkbM family methyltransferase [Paludibacterium paludis]GGY07794.1 hypothetical protein GCM10011289_07910 [Paludibacterium paludis]